MIEWERIETGYQVGRGDHLTFELIVENEHVIRLVGMCKRTGKYIRLKSSCRARIRDKAEKLDSEGIFHH